VSKAKPTTGRPIPLRPATKAGIDTDIDRGTIDTIGLTLAGVLTVVVVLVVDLVMIDGPPRTTNPRRTKAHRWIFSRVSLVSATPVAGVSRCFVRVLVKRAACVFRPMNIVFCCVFGGLSQHGAIPVGRLTLYQLSYARGGCDYSR
jgi:hypothetical protein